MTTIKLKNGSGAPTAGDLAQGEPALDLTNKRLYTEDSGGTVIEVGTNPSTINIDAGTIDGTVIGGSSAAAITGTTITGTSFVSSGNMTFGDNDKAIFGAGSDLQIYHDGSHSYVSDQGTGNLRIYANDLVLANNDGSETFLYGVNGGAVSISYANSAKVTTTSTGIDVTGTAVTDGLTVDGNTTNLNYGKTFFTNGIGTNKWQIWNDNGGSDKFQLVDGDGHLVLQAEQSGDISFYEDTGTTAKLFWDASAESLGLGSTTPDSGRKLHIEGGDTTVGITLKDTAGTQYGVKNDANSFIIRNDSLGLDRLVIDTAGNVGIGTSSPSVELDVRNDGANGIAEIGVRGGTNGAGVVQISGHGTTYGSTSFDLIQNSLAAYAFQRANLPLIFGTNATERMRIDSSGTLLVGTTSESTWESAAGFRARQSGSTTITRDGNPPLYVNRLSSDGTLLQFQKGTSVVGSIGTISGGISIGTGDTGLFFEPVSDEIRPFNTTTNASRDAAINLGNSTKRFKDLYLSGGVISGSGISNYKNTFAFDGTSINGIAVNNTAGSGTPAHIAFFQNGTGVGSITCTASATAYNTSSDYRLKENVVSMTGATARLKQLAPKRFNFIADADVTVDGFLAHEVQSVVPEAITGTHNEVDSDGNPVYQGIDQSKLVPLLVATIQELEARIAALESN